MGSYFMHPILFLTNFFKNTGSMTPKKDTQTSKLKAPQVHHEYILISKTTNENALQILEIFRDQWWKHFLNHQPEMYVNDQVMEFYSTLKYNKEDNSVHASATLLQQVETTKEYYTIDIDMVSIVRTVFLLPHHGDLIHTNLEPVFVEEEMGIMLEHDSLIAPTLKRVKFKPKYKLMLSIIHICFFRLLGYFD